MKLLTKAMQETINYQMQLKSRDIDLCVLNALDNALSIDYVCDSLMLYVNKDGGFGNGLYIDNYNTNTSVYQIYEAFRILDMVGFDSNSKNELFDQIVNKACNYLYNRCELEDNKWNPNVITNNDFAHSQIFTYSDENKKLFGYHPTAAILAYTLKFNKETKAYYKKALKQIRIMLDDFYKMEEFSEFEMISFNTFYRIIKDLNLFTDELDKINNKLILNAENMVKNGSKALDVAFEVSSEYLDNKKNEELDLMISSIAPHGMWEHSGVWGYNKYVEEDSAAIKWIGAETRNNYYILKKYGRLE